MYLSSGCFEQTNIKPVHPSIWVKGLLWWEVDTNTTITEEESSEPNWTTNAYFNSECNLPYQSDSESDFTSSQTLT